MKTRKLIVRKAHKYGTRHLTAGEEYEFPDRHAVALVAAKKARFASDAPMRTTKTQVAPPSAPERIEEERIENVTDIDQLRGQATRLGILVDGRWGVARLQHEIAVRR
jgi:hypothetical protein